MNQPIQIIDLSTDLASRAVQAVYRGTWVDTCPTHLVGVVHDDLGYIVCVTNDDITHVYRYTNREQLKQLKKWPQALNDIASERTGIDLHLPPVLGKRLLGIGGDS